MDNKIKFSEFLHILSQCTYKYPEATVESIGSGVLDDKWCFVLFLQDGDTERKIYVPCLSDELGE